MAFAGGAQAGADAENARDAAASWSALRREKTDVARANSQLLRPMAIGRIWFSTQLLSAGRSPSSR